MEDEMLSNFIPEESRAIGISIVHLHNSRSTTDRKNAHVAASNHDRLTNPLLLPVYQNVLDYRTPLLLDDVRAGERGAREGTRTRFANSRLIEKLVRYKNREIIAAGKMREKSPDSLSVYASRHVSTIYNITQSGTADIINKTPQCTAKRGLIYCKYRALRLNQGNVKKRERTPLSVLICTNNRISSSRRPNSRFSRIYPSSSFWKIS
ncbi:hypothetical protein ALC53_01733 [Atta colombica]|uniref:Uncharacterized protein n=1 Tax=Atta colombica TaxID=520822 RepID=A0A195BT41_9HYME|nr:hypothetical protein ALC53_01733 [Atta colombica]